MKRWDIKDITSLLSKVLFANVFGFLEIFPGDLAAYDLASLFQWMHHLIKKFISIT